MGGIPGGIPLTPAEQAAEEQWASLRRNVQEALRLMPGAPGAGEGPLPTEVDRIVETLHFLYEVTARGQTLYEWLGVAFRIETAEAELLAALAVRDIIVSTQVSGEIDPGADDYRADEAEQAAELFATVSDEIIQ